MYDRILFAVDDDEALPGALEFVAAFARRARAAVRRALDILKSRGVRAIDEVAVSRSVASAIAATAERIGAGMVVLTSRRPSQSQALPYAETSGVVTDRRRSR